MYINKNSYTNRNFARVDLRKIDNALEEAILPQNDLMTLMYVDDFFSKGYNKVDLKGSIGKTDINLTYKKTFKGVNVKGKIGKHSINQYINLYINKYPVQYTVIDVSGKKVKAKAVRVQAFHQGQITSTNFFDGAIYNSIDLTNYLYLMAGQWKNRIKATIKQDVSLIDYKNQQTLNTTTSYYQAPEGNIKAEIDEKGNGKLKGSYYNMKTDNYGNYFKIVNIEKNYKKLKDKVLITGKISSSPIDIVLIPEK